MRRYGRHLLLLALVAGVVSCGGEDYPHWTTKSGLQVTEYVRGEGAPPDIGDIVEIRYTAWYVGDDKPFDSSEGRDEGYRFRLGKEKVLPGLLEGVASMRRGGKRMLLLPPSLAFGEDGLSGVVPPGTWVKFEVELVDFEPAPPPPEPWDDAGMDIVTTESGLQFIDFVVGDGASPSVGGSIVLHFSGFLDDGTVFDTTRNSFTPIDIELNPRVLIPGFVEGVLSMRVGGRRKLIIPPFLGYGEKGFRDRVPPNATLTYDIELLGVH